MSYFMYYKQIFVSKKILSCLVFACVPALLFYSFSLLGLLSLGFTIMEVLRDPAQQSGQSSFLGFVSNIGIWLWVSSAAICFFSFLIHNVATSIKHKELLLLLGLLSAMLATDDFFLIHDRYINQNICYFLYACFAGILLMRHHKKIIEIDGFSFLLAGLLLALSILTDLTQKHIALPYQYSQVFEEGFKFVGAVTWLYFSFRAASFYLSTSRKN